MKLHRLEIENLNSLYGTHVIDFDKALQGAPLFLIHGPTGAGKSTLLDAIALGLYGRTTRLPKPNGTAVVDAAADDPRLIMSRGEARSSVRLVFSQEPLADNARRVFRACWTIRRAHSRPDGNLQAPARELYRLQSPTDPDGELIAGGSASKHYDKAFEEALCGMDFATFERMMMLPQGQFAQFLKGDTKKKSELLRTMLSDDIGVFIDIGSRINEAKKSADQKLATLNEVIRGMQGDPESDTEESLESMTERLQELGELSQRKNVAFDQVSSRRDAIKLVVQATEELQTATLAHAELQTELQQRQEEFAALARHEQGEQVRKAEEALPPLRQQITVAEESEKEIENDLNTSHERHRAQEELQGEAETSLQVAVDAQSAAAPQIATARELEKELTATRLQLTTNAEKIADADATLQRALDDHADQTIEAEKLQEKLRNVGEELAALPPADELAGLEATLDEHARAEQKHRQNLDQANGHLQELSKRRSVLESARQKALENRDRTARALDETSARLDEHRRILTSIGLDCHLPTSELRMQVDTRRDALATSAADLQARQEAVVEKTEERTTLARVQTAKNRELLSLSTEVHRLQAVANDASDQLQQARTTLRHFDQLHAMVEHVIRLQQEPDSACALCGSQNHDHQHVARLAEELAADSTHRTTLAHKVSDAEVHAQNTQAELATATSRVQELTREANERAAAIQVLDEAIVLRLTLPTDSAPLEPEELFARANDAATSKNAWETELPTVRATIDALQSDLLTADSQRQQIEGFDKDVREASDQLPELTTEATNLQEQLAEQEELLQGSVTELTRTREQALTLLGVDDEPIDRLLSALRSKLTRQATLVATSNEQQQRLDGLHRQIENLSEQCARARVNLAEYRGRKSELDETLETLVARRAEALPSVDVDAYAQQLQIAVDNARESRDRAIATVAELTTEIASKSAKLEAQKNHVQYLREQLAIAVVLLDEALAESSFDSLQEVHNATMPADEVIRLTRQRQNLLEEIKEAASRLRDREAKTDSSRDALSKLLSEQQTELAVDLTDWSAQLASIDSELACMKEELESLNQSWGELSNQLKERQKSAQKMADLLKQREALLGRAERLRQLDKLIGGEKGKNFEARALALMLDRLLVVANGWLGTFSPRYQLRSAANEEGVPTLDFVIEDLHHAGAQRPVTTISGGETFMVSLALALSLSSNRSLPYRIETLLIDEGFGTLDQDTLAIVMNTLQALHERNGHTVGIISHVAGLTEQIPAQIRLHSQGNGRAHINAGIFNAAGEVSAT